MEINQIIGWPPEREYGCSQFTGRKEEYQISFKQQAQNILLCVTHCSWWKMLETGTAIWESEHFKNTCSWHKKCLFWRLPTTTRCIMFVFMKWFLFFYFFFLFREMRTASQNPFKTHFTDGCSRTAFIIPPTFARQLYSGKGRVSYTEGHCWEQETWAGGRREVESQMVVSTERFHCLKKCGKTRINWWQEMGHGRIWFGWDAMVFSAWYWLHSWNSMVRSTSRQFGRLIFK